jgi:hypothetical protein
MNTSASVVIAFGRFPCNLLKLRSLQGMEMHMNSRPSASFLICQMIKNCLHMSISQMSLGKFWRRDCIYSSSPRFIWLYDMHKLVGHINIETFLSIFCLEVMSLHILISIEFHSACKNT